METNHIVAIVACIVAILAIIIYSVKEIVHRTTDGLSFAWEQFNVYNIFYCPALLGFTVAYIGPNNFLNWCLVIISAILALAALCGRWVDKRYQP